MSNDSSMKDSLIEYTDEIDGKADAIAAVALILIFVATCIFWISTQ